MISKLSIYARLFLILECLSFSAPMSCQMLEAKITRSIDLSRTTALYVDCEEAAKNGDIAELDLLNDHWNASLKQAKHFLGSNESRIKWAISLEGSIDYHATRTHATVDQVSQRISSAKLVTTRTDGAPHSFIEGPPVIEMTTGLIRRVCRALVPSGDFQKLLAEAKESEQRSQNLPEQRFQEQLAEQASKLAASFLLHDITYAGLRLFTVSHELSHAALDRFSTDLTDGTVYSGGQECANAFFTETRADLIGQAAVESTPLNLMLGDPFAGHLHEFGKDELSKMIKAATVLSSDDQLSIVVSTKEWESGSCLLPEQRRQVLHDSILRRKH